MATQDNSPGGPGRKLRGEATPHLQSFSYLGDRVDGGSHLQQQLHDPDVVLLAGDV